MRAAIYTRISDARDHDTAGVDRQEEDCRALVDQRGWTVEGLYCDNNRSAITGVRPEYRRLLDDVKAGAFDVVVVWASDRLYRRLTDLEEIAEALHEVQVVTVKSGTVDLTTATGRMQAEFLGVVAKHESAQRGERVARAALQRAEAGRFNGGTRRFGYNETMTELLGPEAEAIAWGYGCVLSGGSLREVAREWTKRGFVGPSTAGFYAGSVRSILLRPVNAGISTYRGKEVGRSLAPAIVGEDEYRTVRAILTDPRRRSSPDSSRRTLLSGVLVCGVCGSPVRAHMRHRPDRGGPAPAYACINRHVSRSRGKLDDAISNLVVAYLIQHRATYRRAPQTASKAAQRASAEAAGIQKRLDDLAALVAGGELSPADYAPAARGLRERLVDAESRVTRHAGTPATSKLLEAEDVRSAWAASPASVQRAVIKELVEAITLPVGTPGKFSMAGTAVQWRTRS